jgi:ankyrin repeat protein
MNSQLDTMDNETRIAYEKTALGATWKLYDAVYNKNNELCEEILKQGIADPNMQIKYGIGSFLHMAIKQNNLELCNLLVKYGAKIDDKKYDECGRALLHIACVYGYKSIYDWLVSNGVDINKHCKFIGHIPLIYAINGMNREHDNDCYAIIQDLLYRGTDIHNTNANGNTPLHLAAVRGLFDVCELLIRNGADIMALNTYGETSLDYAEYNPELVEFLKKINDEMQELRCIFKRAQIEEDSDDDI